MLKVVHVVVFAAVVVMAGCATAHRGAPEQAASEVGEAAPATIVTAEVPLTGDLLYRILAAEMAAQRGHIKPAVDTYVQLTQEVPDARIAERATRLAVYARDDAAALATALRWAEYDPTSVDAQRATAALLIRAGRTAEARAYLEAVLDAYHDRRDHGFILVANMLDRGEDRDSAVDVMRAIVATRQDDPFAQYAYSNIALKAGHLEDALTAIDQALREQPMWSNAIVFRAHILRELGRMDEALAYLAQNVKLYPKAGDIRMAYARTLVAEERLDEGLQQLEILVKQAPKNDEVLYSAGVLAMELGKYREAEQRFNRLIELGERLDAAHYHLGQIYEAGDGFDDAIDMFSAVGAGDFYLSAQIRIAYIISRQGELAAARSHLHVLMVENPQEKRRLYLAEGDILRNAKQYGEAFAVYDSALAEFPDDRTLLYMRAMLAERIDRLDITERDLLSLIAKEPDNADLLNDLGYTLADRTDRYDDAYAYIKRALELKPDSHFILDSMGWVLYHLGDYDQALEYLRRAMGDGESLEPEIAAHLGEVLWVTGDREAALDLWRRALHVAPENETLLKVIKRFEAGL